MTRLLKRTSITIDEAISMLLGRSTGPIDYEPIDGAEDAEADGAVFSLQDELEDELEVLAGEYQLAKHEKRPPEFIAEKHAALQRQEAVIERANLYLCAVNDELNKGDQSVLKWDTAFSNAAYKFITLHSFNEWVKSSSDPSTESVPLSVKEKKPRKRMREQENAILEEIRKQGLDPQALPPYLPGKRGVKSDIRDSLKYSPLFTAKTAFKNAWEDLADYHLTRYANDPTPNKKMKKDTS